MYMVLLSVLVDIPVMHVHFLFKFKGNQGVQIFLDWHYFQIGCPLCGRKLFAVAPRPLTKPLAQLQLIQSLIPTLCNIHKRKYSGRWNKILFEIQVPEKRSSVMPFVGRPLLPQQIGHFRNSDQSWTPSLLPSMEGSCFQISQMGWETQWFQRYCTRMRGSTHWCRRAASFVWLNVLKFNNETLQEIIDKSILAIRKSAVLFCTLLQFLWIDSWISYWFD